MKISINKDAELTLQAETDDEDFMLTSWLRDYQKGEALIRVMFTDEEVLSHALEPEE